MPFMSATLIVDARRVEELADVLMDRGALSVDVTDAAAGTARETPLFAEPGSSPAINWPMNRVVALFSQDADIASAVPEALGAVSLPIATPFAIDQVDDQDWVRLTQQQFAPVQVSSRLWVVPT